MFNNIKSLFSRDAKTEKSKEILKCGQRTYILESRVTKNGHKYVLITERSFGRSSKIMLFHDHFDEFRASFDRVSQADPLSPDTTSFPQ